MANRIPPNYSSPDKAFYGPIPTDVSIEPGSQICGSTQPTFPVSRYAQTDIMQVIRDDPADGIRELSHVSLSEVLNPIKGCVGRMLDANGRYLGSCTLISANLAITACHSIEGIADLRNLLVNFGYYMGSMQQFNYPVVGVVEYNQQLDFAILSLKGNPGSVYGYPKLHLSKPVHSEPALLHYPLNKPLKVSVHGYLDSNYGYYLSTYHDSDYGSSGGAYIDPSGTLVAIHLGAERAMNYNLLRLALPVAIINQVSPQGILAQFANGHLNQKLECTGGLSLYELPSVCRELVDLEKFERTNLLEGNAYYLRRPTAALPGVIIEFYQKKHCPNWPGVWPGKKGSSFSLPLDDTIQLAEVIIATAPTFNQLDPANPKPSKFYWNVDGRLLTSELYKKLKHINQIAIYAGFDQKSKHWEFHFFPDE